MPGQQATLKRVLTADDIWAFAVVSGDVNPAHVDAEHTQGTRFHEFIAHGRFAGALPAPGARE